jgi:hypothetical protein
MPMARCSTHRACRAENKNLPELRVPDLERKLVARVRLFDFGEKNVGVMVVTYPIDFLPS